MLFGTANTTTHKVMDGFKDNLAEDVIYNRNEMDNGFWGMPAKTAVCSAMLACMFTIVL